MLSATDPKKAVMSWRVSLRISSMRLILHLAIFILGMALRGITPVSAQASQTAISTSSHLLYLFSSDHTFFISGREYRSIMTLSFVFRLLKWHVSGSDIFHQLYFCSSLRYFSYARLIVS